MAIIEDNTAEVVVEATGRITNILRVLALEVVVEAKRIVPVDTGRLRRSIHARVGDDVAIIGSRVPYAAFVEMGTPKMRAQPYLRPALEMVVNKWRSQGTITPGWIVFTADKAEADMRQIAREVVAEAKRRVPVVTGRLQESIYAEIDVEAKTITVGSPVHYAPYVEILKPYLRPALELIKSRWKGF